MAGLNVRVDECGQMVVNVRLIGMKRYQLRLWLMARLFWLAACVAPKNMSVVIEHAEVWQEEKNDEPD